MVVPFDARLPPPPPHTTRSTRSTTMSRAALWMAEQRQMQAAAAAAALPSAEETREVKANELKIHGNLTTFNLNTLLSNNIYECDYFRALYQITTYHEVLDEIYSKVTMVEPWATGTSRLPSTAFCLLMKFFTMRLTRKQLTSLITHGDSPYIRAIGFLYLRYGCDPKEMWEWFAPYVDDPEEFAPSSDPNAVTTIGQWLRGLLSELQYYGTMLPRIPVPIERKIKMRLVLLEENKKRAKANRRHMGAFREGAKVKAIYEDADNDPAWYTAVITEVHEDDQFLVTFDGWGNQEVVGLGDMMLPGPPAGGGGGGGGEERRGGSSDRRSRSRSRERDRDAKRRSRSRSRSRDDRRGRGGQSEDLLGKNLMEAVMKKEREKVESRGKDYASRPATFKGSLTLKADSYSHRGNKRSRSPDRGGGDRRDRDRDRHHRRSRSHSRGRSSHRPPAARAPSPREDDRDRDRPPQPPKPDSAKLKALKEAYGDASAKKDDV